MARFNTTKTVVNQEGATAYKTTPEMELYLLASATFLNDKYYESGDDQLKRLVKLSHKVPVDFLASLCIYVREEMKLRTVSHVLTAELIQRTTGGIGVQVLTRVCQRPDDMLEILAYYMSKYKKMTHQLRKGLERAFLQFDEYQLAKYNPSKGFTLKRLVHLTHIKSELADKVCKGTLKTPDTWEVALSTGQDKKETWTRMITEGSIGYMALLRNLRNIINTCDQDVIEKAATIIADPERVKKSKQLPFRFWSAYKIIQQDTSSPYTSLVLQAIEDALASSVANLSINGVSLVASDVSGSMRSPISRNSIIQQIEIGLVMSGLVKCQSKHSVVGVFGNFWKVKNITGRSPLELIKSYQEGEVGYSTHGHLPVEWATENNCKVDNIFLFTDTEMYGGSLQNAINEYKSKVNKDVRVFIFNLANQGTVQARGNGVYNIGGWSEKVFEYVNNIENAEKVVKSIVDKYKDYLKV